MKYPSNNVKYIYFDRDLIMAYGHYGIPRDVYDSRPDDDMVYIIAYDNDILGMLC